MKRRPQRGLYIWDRRKRDWIPAAKYHAARGSGPRGPAIWRDYEPFRSPEDGSIIDGRAAYREHLKRHNLICIGNEYPKPAQMKTEVPVAETLKRVWHDENYRRMAVRQAEERARRRLEFEA